MSFNTISKETHPTLVDADYTPVYARSGARKQKKVKSWMILAPIGAVVLIGGAALILTTGGEEAQPLVEPERTLEPLALAPASARTAVATAPLPKAAAPARVVAAPAPAIREAAPPRRTTPAPARRVTPAPAARSGTAPAPAPSASTPTQPAPAQSAPRPPAIVVEPLG